MSVEAVGLFACDPGGKADRGKTGLGWGIFETGRSVERALENRWEYGSHTVMGSELLQMREIVKRWRVFSNACAMNGLAEEQIWFIMEDFVLRPGMHGGGKESTTPVAIAWAVYGYLLGAAAGNGVRMANPLVFQMPGDAATFATNERMRHWGIWVKGREHERSAWAHIALRLGTLANQR